VIKGLVTFTNRPKAEAYKLIQTLQEADLKVKMITGDNIFVAVQTALALGFASQQRSILIL
jgi:magnesium-transporting ATPase (P-type)